jgi:hypothetical protein
VQLQNAYKSKLLTSTECKVQGENNSFTFTQTAHSTPTMGHYRVDVQRIGVQFQTRTWDFCPVHTIETSSGAQGVKQSGCKVQHTLKVNE